MTLKKKIFVFNTFMVFISLSLMLFITVNIFDIFKKNYLKKKYEDTKLDENAYFVQTELYNIGKYNFDYIASNLKKYDYQILVKNYNNDLFSNLDKSEIKEIKFFEKENIKKNVIQTYRFSHYTLLRLKYESNLINYDIYAIHDDKKTNYFYIKSDEEELQLFFIYFTVIISIASFIVLLVSQIFTKKLIKYIMYPLDELRNGAKRIENGNLSSDIVYTGAKEFEDICNNFNQMQKSIKEEREKNEAHEKSRIEMISGITHDLKTPLTAIKAYIKGIKDGVASSTVKKNLYLEIAYEQASNMGLLIDKLFLLSKLEVGTMPFNLKSLNLNNFLNIYIKNLKNLYFEKNINFIYSNFTYDICVLLDVVQFERVLNNIVENSIKYAKVENLIINFELENNNKYISLIICDNGLGVNPKKISKIFEQFYREDESRSNKNSPGNGLGLYIAKNIVEKHNGNIKAINNNGLKIIINLPII